MKHRSLEPVVVAWTVDGRSIFLLASQLPRGIDPGCRDGVPRDGDDGQQQDTHSGWEDVLGSEWHPKGHILWEERHREERECAACCAAE